MVVGPGAAFNDVRRYSSARHAWTLLNTTGMAPAGANYPAVGYAAGGLFVYGGQGNGGGMKPLSLHL